MNPATKIKRPPHTEERKRNIGLSRQVKLIEEDMASLRRWWSLGYVTGSYIKRELKIGDKVYNRLMKEFCDQEQIQFLPQNLEIPTSTEIYKNKTLIFILNPEDPMAILIESKAVAESFKKYFEILWKQAKK